MLLVTASDLCQRSYEKPWFAMPSTASLHFHPVAALGEHPVGRHLEALGTKWIGCNESGSLVEEKLPSGGNNLLVGVGSSIGLIPSLDDNDS